MFYIISYKYAILYMIIYICVFFMCIIFTKYVNAFPIHYVFHVADFFPRSSASDAKPGHCHCCGCLMTTPNHHHHPESLRPSDLTGSMSMMPMTTRSCQLWSPSSPRAELRMELVELPKSCVCHGSLNVPIEHHPTMRYIVYNGYYKVMSNIPKMGHLPTPVCTYGYLFWNDVASPFWTTSQRDLRLGTAPAIRSWCSAPWWLIRPPCLSCKI